MTLQGERQNRAGFRVETVNASAATTLPDLPVPDGYDVVVRADTSNGDDVEVRDGEGGALPLEPGASVSLGVTNRSQITVAPASGTQTVHATVEV
jgi:hypothetical protein